MKYIFYFLFSLCFYIGASASPSQDSALFFISKEDGKSVPFVNILKPNGQVIAVSDLDGKIYLKDLEKRCSPNDSLTISHISYKSFSTTLSALRNQHSISLEEKKTTLNAVVVNEQNNPDFIVLEGFVRSYSYVDKTPYEYFDGMIQYFIPVKKGKLSAKYNITEYRYISDKDSFTSKKKFVSIEPDPTDIPPIYLPSTMSYLSRYYGVENSDKNLVAENKHVSMGKLIVDTQSKTTELVFDFIPPEKKNKMVKMLSLRMIPIANIRTETYNTTYLDDRNLQVFLKTLHTQWSRKFKHKKEPQFHLQETFQDFYVTDIRYFQKKEVKKGKHLKFYDILSNSSSFTHEYWHFFDNKVLPADFTDLIKSKK